MSVFKGLMSILLVVGSFLTGSARALDAMADHASPKDEVSGRDSSEGSGASCVGGGG